MAVSKLSPARAVAYDAFVEALGGQAAESVLDKGFRDKKLKRIDRNLATEIVYGGLRWYSKIFWILQNSSSRDLEKVTPEIRAALVLGTYQIFYLDRVPDRAAVNESVEYVKAKGQKNASSFVNGILRQISRRAEYFPKPNKEEKPVEYLSLQFAHPEWMVGRWFKHFRFARLEGMLADNNKPPPWSVRVNLCKTSIDDVHLLQQKLLKEERTHSDRRPLRSCIRLKEAPQMDPGSLFGSGYFTIQDEAAQLVTLLVAPESGQTIIDGCCGKGGKLTQILEMSPEVKVIGVDASSDQLTTCEENLKRLELVRPTLVNEDFLDFGDIQQADKILLDAPCSGLGVLRRYPEGKWLKKEETIRVMAEKQRALLERALKDAKPGAEIVYAVCSFEVEESIDQLNFLKKRFGDMFELVSPVSRVPDYYKKYVTRDNILSIYHGNQDGMDGFSSFILKKL